VDRLSLKRCGKHGAENALKEELNEKSYGSYSHAEISVLNPKERRQMKKYFVMFTLLLLAGAAYAEQMPNVVLIFADDLGYGDLGCYGATKLKTPNIDKLAAEGRRFTDAHSASAVCTPSRYALMTGEYPHRKSLYAPVFLKTGLVVDTQQQTMASVLKDAGYETAIIGKWHLGFGDKTPDWNGELKPGPLECGFDYYYGVPVVNSHPPFVYVENHQVVGLVPDDPFVYGQTAKTKVVPEKMQLNAIGGADAAHALYDDYQVGTHLTKKAVEWIKARGKNKFFLCFTTTNIHHPFTPAPRFQGTSECGLYGDFVHELDWMVGEVVKTLEEQGVADNTLIIVTSDNGGMFNHTGQEAWKMGHALNGKYLGFKFDAWEGGHRVPFIARWPGKVEAGTASDELICNVDMIATFAALTGQELKDGRDSVNIMPALTGGSVERDHLLLSPFRKSHLAIRKGKWMYISGQGGGGFSGRKVGAHGFGGPPAITFSGRENSDIENGKVIEDAPPSQLYDLENDPAQTTNLYNQYPEVVQEMAALLATYKPAAPAKKKGKK
jgi:arylsulfatase A-like enzyme